MPALTLPAGVRASAALTAPLNVALLNVALLNAAPLDSAPANAARETPAAV